MESWKNVTNALEKLLVPEHATLRILFPCGARSTVASFTAYKEWIQRL